MNLKELRTPKPGHFWAYVCDREGETAEPRIVIDTHNAGCHCVSKDTEKGYFQNINYIIVHYNIWSKIDGSRTANSKGLEIIKLSPDNFGEFTINKLFVKSGIDDSCYMEVKELTFKEGFELMQKGQLFAEVIK